MLVSPDFSQEFILYTNISDIRFGAILLQDFGGGGGHPVLYLSRKLFPREQLYSTIEKKSLAIKWAVDALRYYLLGSPFSLITDHAPL